MSLMDTNYVTNGYSLTIYPLCIFDPSPALPNISQLSPRKPDFRRVLWIGGDGKSPGEAVENASFIDDKQDSHVIFLTNRSITSIYGS